MIVILQNETSILEEVITINGRKYRAYKSPYTNSYVL